MGSAFYQLLDSMMLEVSRRDGSYASLFPITIPNREMAPAYLGDSICNQVSWAELGRAVEDGLDYVAREWTTLERTGDIFDPMARFLLTSIIDAFWADQGIIGLQPLHRSSCSVADILNQDYAERQASAGRWYYVRNRGSRPLLVVTATGTPVGVWTQFLADKTHDFKIILPRRRGSDLFDGGVQEAVDIREDSTDLASVLDAEAIAQVDVLAWCNGARVGIDLVNKEADRVSSLILLGPMLKGIRGVPHAVSAFERDLQPLLEAVLRDSAWAPVLSKAIWERAKSPEWTRLKSAPISRTQTLFALPAKEYALDMIAPLGDPKSMLNIAKRVAADEDYPTRDALENLKTRVMVILGSDDNIVSNELTTSVMSQFAPKVLKVSIGASGHYIHDLQYCYFRWLLNEFVEGRDLRAGTARVTIERIGRSAPTIAHA